MGSSNFWEVLVGLYLSVMRGKLALGKLQPQTFSDYILAQTCHMERVQWRKMLRVHDLGVRGKPCCLLWFHMPSCDRGPVSGGWKHPGLHPHNSFLCTWDSEWLLCEKPCSVPPVRTLSCTLPQCLLNELEHAETSTTESDVGKVGNGWKGIYKELVGARS